MSRTSFKGIIYHNWSQERSYSSTVPLDRTFKKIFPGVSPVAGLSCNTVWIPKHGCGVQSIVFHYSRRGYHFNTRKHVSSKPLPPALPLPSPPPSLSPPSPSPLPSSPRCPPPLTSIRSFHAKATRSTVRCRETTRQKNSKKELPAGQKKKRVEKHSNYAEL